MKLSKQARQRHVPVLLAAWLLATSGLRPLLLPDEGRYAEVARAMLSGDWLVPRLNGLPFFHKPPLFYWLDLTAFHVFGVDEFAARFGASVGAWIMGMALWLSMRRSHGDRAANLALVVLATTPFFFIGGQFANHDMLVGGLITAAVLAIVRAVDRPPAVDLRWLAAGWVFCGLALLSKGLIGVVLPALVIGPWLLFEGRWRQMLRLLHPVGLLAFCVVAGPWCIAMQLRFDGFFHYFIVEQHFQRYTQSDFNNVHGLWFFIVLTPALTLPWSAWLPSVFRMKRVEGQSLHVWWVIAVVGFFSIPSSKLIGYALPALAPACALLALAMTNAPPRRLLAVGGLAALLCLLPIAVATWRTPNSNRALGLLLRSRMAPGDRVVMVEAFYYDVPFYARLRQPVVILGNWTDPDIPRHDNWRKEIFDAARFDPARGRQLLQPFDRIEALTCGTGTTWFVVPVEQSARVASLPGAQPLFKDPRRQLWRVPGHAC